MRKPRKIKRTKKGNVFLQVFIMTFICVFISAGVAYGWQSIEDKKSMNEEEPYSPSEQSSKEETPSKLNPGYDDTADKDEEENSSEKNPEENSGEEISSEPVEEQGYGMVAESERVRSNYFDDAVFIGDSITTGISLYDIMPNAEVFASVGVNLQSIMNAEVVPDGDGDNKITVLQALEKTDANKIYIMLGANGLAFLGAEQTRDLYSSFVDEVIKIKPDSIIYIQSVFPIDEAKFAQRYQGHLTNEIIDETNRLLLEMAEEKKIYYVSPADVFKDENGGLMTEVTPDGLHFNSEYYSKWMDYLKTHTLSKK